MSPIAAEYAGRQLPRSATACQAHTLPCLTGSAAISGPAPIIALMPKSGGAGLETQLLILREILAADLRQARRKHLSTSSIMARLRAVTNQTLSRRGCGDQQHFAPGA